MTLKTPYNRENEIRKRLNFFFSQNFSLPEEDYYSKLTPDAILALKSALSDINNMLTMKVTLAFAEWVSEKLNLDKSAKDELTRIVLESKPSSNGYDIWLGYPVTFAGEVKCNIPLNNGEIYGAAQRHGIERDITGLLHGKKKASFSSASCLKFIAFLDTPKIRKANSHLIKTNKTCKDVLIFPSETQALDRTDVVYGIYVSPSA